MKGLILKDLFNLKKQARFYIAIPLFMAVLSAFSSGSMQMFAIAYCLLFSIMLPITTLSLDERANWDPYALCMPVSRRSVVLSKYLLGLLFILASVLLCFLAAWLRGAAAGFAAFDVQKMLFSIVWMTVGACVLFAVFMPIMFRIGTEKGRIVMIGVIVVPVLLLSLLSSTEFFSAMGGNTIEQALAAFFTGNAALPFVAAGAAAVLLVLSALLSVTVYSKKEF